MSELKFKKESSIARDNMSLERLLAVKASAETRFEIMKNSKIFSDSDIIYVEASISDLDRRINQRKIKIVKAARRIVLDAADFLDPPVLQKIANLWTDESVRV